MVSGTSKEILLSVRSPYAELLVNGVKTYELRRRFPTDLPSGTKVLIYASGGTKGIIGECRIHTVHELPLDKLWAKVCRDSMISWEEYKSYFQGLIVGYALEIVRARRYGKPIGLADVLPKADVYRPPQSFQYLRDTNRASL